MRDILIKDDTHAGALDQLGACALFFNRDWTNAEAFMARAEQAQSEQFRHFYRAWQLRIRGQFAEARVEQEKSEHPELTDPEFRFMMCSSRWAEGQYDEAIQVARRTLELNPNPLGEYNYHYWRANRLVGNGNYAAGLKAIRKAQALSPKQELTALLDYAYAKMGRTDEAREVLKQLPERSSPYLQPYFVARIHAALVA